MKTFKTWKDLVDFTSGKLDVAEELKHGLEFRNEEEYDKETPEAIAEEIGPFMVLESKKPHEFLVDIVKGELENITCRETKTHLSLLFNYCPEWIRVSLCKEFESACSEMDCEIVRDLFDGDYIRACRY